MSLDFFTRADIEMTIGRIDVVLATNIFAVENSHHPLVRAALVEVLVCLKDLMWKSKTYASRISFTDDVIIVPQNPGIPRDKGVQDVTDLITVVRDALCHIDLYTHYLVPPKSKAVLIIVYGKGHPISSSAPSRTSDYDDDVCFMVGLHRIYLKRHIIRAFEEAKQQLLPLL
jgi:hypothetical protein